MPERVMTDANGRKYITNEPLLHPPKRPWVDLTDGDWEWVADIKETSLDTFAHGAAWAADQLKEKNT